MRLAALGENHLKDLEAEAQTKNRFFFFFFFVFFWLLHILGVDSQFFSTIVLFKGRSFSLGFLRFAIFFSGKKGEGTPRLG